MTSKHFEALAVALAHVRPDIHRGASVYAVNAWAESVRAVADVCGQGNPRFDRARFISACDEYQTAILYGVPVRVKGGAQ